VALRLKRRGISRVRPLEGGYAGWVAEGYPLQRWGPAETTSTTLVFGS
jgi:3-mercaptopyruvate sulfurtransferase SseA